MIYNGRKETLPGYLHRKRLLRSTRRRLLHKRPFCNRDGEILCPLSVSNLLLRDQTAIHHYRVTLRAVTSRLPPHLQVGGSSSSVVPSSVTSPSLQPANQTGLDPIYRLEGIHSQTKGFIFTQPVL
ncbi:hypothetical protein IGI04_005298 [Brassica rapa subsp. trilocularis]|uniref:Uncharacterized protein n=1 Tax=Brassica rapa subsp. trilocularis TaxID=1813537 RepID=A0ABQ7NDM4_BRACM|nr:hypothetical protein IGI04_005298 [Brassica rapa subsp. trilocularis]